MLAVVLGAADAPLAPLLLPEVLEGAQASFPSMRAARSDVQAAQGDQQAADGAFDPVWKTRATSVPIGGYPQTRLDSVVEVPTPLWGASLFGGYRLGLGSIQDYYGERRTWSAGELRAGASVPVLRNGPIDRRRANQARAELASQLATLGVEQQRIEVVRLATFRYLDWVVAGNRREVLKELLELARVRDSQLASRASEGDVAQIERQENQRAVLQRQALVVQAQRGIEQAAFELSLYVRSSSGASSSVDERRLPQGLSAPEAPSNETFDLDALLARRPDVQRLIGQRAQAEVELKLAKNQLLPSLDLSVAVSKDLGVSPSAAYDKLGPAELELSAVLEVPVLYRAPLGRLTSAQATISKLDAQLQLLRERVSVELNDAQSALSAAHQRYVLLGQEVDVATKLERAERTKFQLGDSSLLFVNLREQATAEARLRQLDALVDFHKARASLQAALAVPERS